MKDSHEMLFQSWLYKGSGESKYWTIIDQMEKTSKRKGKRSSKNKVSHRENADLENIFSSSMCRGVSFTDIYFSEEKSHPVNKLRK